MLEENIWSLKVNHVLVLWSCPTTNLWLNGTTLPLKVACPPPAVRWQIVPQS
jgi:hypothetical protein